MRNGGGRPTLQTSRFSECDGRRADYCLDMITLVAILYAAGGALPLLGLLWASCRAHRRYRELADRTRWLPRIIERTGPNPSPEVLFEVMYWYRNGKRDAEHPAQLWFAPEIAQQAVWDELRRPAVVAGVGVMCGTAGSLLSLLL